jgi:hypothetical protein
MDTEQTKRNDKTKHDDEIKQDEILKPLSARDMIQPAEELHETSPEREWQIKRLQEQLGVPERSPRRWSMSHMGR